MEALRIILTQNVANYKREETITNKMTYPLPPFSTVIGAIHVACGYREYKAMDISIQGTYESLSKEPYTDYCFLNSVMDDRGILVKLRNSNLLSNSFERVAKALKPTGNSFKKGITIQSFNDELLDEYRALKDLKDDIDKFKKERLNKTLEIIKKRKKTLATKKKSLPKDSKELITIKAREIEVKELEKNIKEKFDNYIKVNYEIPYSRYASLTTSLKYYETLNNVKLILHIRSDKDTLMDIKENIYNIKSIGRSEDFVDIKDVRFVNLVNEVEEPIESENSAYIDYDLPKEDLIFLNESDSRNYNGTKYYLNKNYEIINNKRVFKKKKVLYVSKYKAEEGNENLYFDISGNESYIVNFI